jgi:hypothetical protein
MEIVTLPFIQYTDELAYMEHLDHPDTQKAISAEAERWQRSVQKLGPSVDRWLLLLQEAEETLLKKPHYESEGLDVRYLDHDLKHLTYKKRTWPCIYEYSLFQDLLLVIEDIKWQGSERKKLTAYRQSDLSVAWSVENVGSMITSKDKIIVQTSKEVQRFYTLEEITEQGERIPLVKSRSKNQVVRASQVVGTKLWYFQEGRRFKNIYTYDFTTKHSKKVLGKPSLLGFSYPFWWSDVAVYNIRSTQEVWQVPDNRKINDIYLGDNGFFCQTITHQIIQLSWIRDGQEKVLFRPNSAGKLLLLAPQKFLWFSPTSRAQQLTIAKDFSVNLAKAPDLGLEADYSILSREGHHIPATTIFQKGKEPVALIAYVYGHYGIPTPAHLIPRFYAFILAGYAVSFIAVRGGGDNGLEGWDSARGNNRLVGLLDYISAVPQVQGLFNVKPQRTILYGRSAGGFHIANAVQKVSKPRLLCGAACAEVPFVDVVKGCVNDVIPVLRLEVDEFFNCSDYDGFRAAASLDPLLTGTDGPGVPILASGGLHDTEVMYWEPLKWTSHLRKKGWAKIACRIDEETGHFMQGPYALKKRAEESAWLHACIGLD